MNELLNEYTDITYSEYELHIQGIVDSIANGERQDQYKNWAKHPDVSVREALVKHGYELDTLIHDPLSSMRMEVVRKDPTYIKEAPQLPTEYHRLANGIYGISKNDRTRPRSTYHIHEA